MKLTASIRQQAERVVPLTMDDARALPAMLGRIVPAMLLFHGFYTCKVGDVRTLYVLAGTKPDQTELRRYELMRQRDRAVAARDWALMSSLTRDLMRLPVKRVRRAR